jgi:4'-phosphopantetheinyl transferase
VDVWLAAPAEIAPRWDWLSPEERARADRFLVPHAREEFIAARALVRGALEKCGAGPAAALRFSIGAHGRPALDPPRPFDFNLSHTRGLIACAIGPGTFGVDVENLSRATHFTGVARVVFSEREQAELARQADPRRYFFSLWTLKEAYIKARGLGFSLPPRQVEVTLEPSPHIADPGWRVALFEATPDHVGALAIRAPEPVRCTLHRSARADEVILV